MSWPSFQSLVARPVLRKPTSEEGAYVNEYIAAHRGINGSLILVFAIILMFISFIIIKESIELSIITSVVGAAGVSWLWFLYRPQHYARLTDEVVALKGRALEVPRTESMYAPDLFGTHTIGGTRAHVPHGWVATVGEDDELDAEAVVVYTGAPGESDFLGVSRRYVVVAARRISDGASLSLADEVAVGGGRYHRPFAGVIAPSLWFLSSASAFIAVLSGRLFSDAAANIPYTTASSLIAVACFVLSVATGVPFLRARARVEMYRDQVGLMPAAERQQRRMKFTVGAAVFGAATGGAGAALMGFPLWFGAAAMALMLAPSMWYMPLPTVKTRS